MDYRAFITIDPAVRSGKPCIRGMRITVTDVLEYLAGGMSEDEILKDGVVVKLIAVISGGSR